MPQFDTFIFSSSLFYFILSFLLVLYLNYVHFLPRLSSILKLRNKISGQNAKTQENDISMFFSGFSYITSGKKE